MLSDEEFGRLLQSFNRPWAGYRKVRKGVKKRLRRHMEKLGCKTVGQYLQRLQSDAEAEAVCEACLLVTISRFYRDRNLWKYLRECLLPRIWRDSPAPIRVWCAGCACGEEPFSLAMVWASMEGAPELELLATDTQRVCLERAKLGRYGRSSLKEVPPEIKAAFFETPSNQRRFIIQKERLPAIRWQQHNLLDPPPAGPFQMIFLRNNLLTYHHGPQLKAAFDRIMTTLAPRGYLIVGSHEKIPSSARSLVRDPHCPWVYQIH